MRAAAIVAVALVAAWSAEPAAARTGDYCCAPANLSATYDTATKRITAHWAGDKNGVTAVELRIGDRLGADGVVDRGTRTIRIHAKSGGAGVAAGPLAVVLDNHGGVFAQVRFRCATRQPAPYCTSGAFWSKPAHVTAEDSPQTGGAGNGGSTSGSGYDITETYVSVHFHLNGTNECLLAVGKVKSVIEDLKENTAAAKRAASAHQSAARYAKRQAELLAELKRDYASYKLACK